MRHICGTHIAWGNSKLLWECPNQSTGCIVGFFADVAMYRCDKCRAINRGIKT